MSYVRLSIAGTSPGGEVWSVNPVLDPTGEFPGGVNQANLDSAALTILQTCPDFLTNCDRKPQSSRNSWPPKSRCPCFQMLDLGKAA